MAEKDIVLVTGNGSYCKIFNVDGEVIELSHNLNAFQNRLTSDCFYRCHQSFLLNLMHCQEVVTQGRQLFVSLSGNQEAKVARSRKKELILLMKN
jgi:two-component system LytT family response regulator